MIRDLPDLQPGLKAGTAIAEEGFPLQELIKKAEKSRPKRCSYNIFHSYFLPVDVIF
jgi:hypothetical protein